MLDPSAGPEISLSLAEAVHRGLQFNLGQVNASAAMRQARALRGSAFSELLPHASASMSETGAKVDLQTEGLSADAFGSNSLLASSFPVTVGPFHYYSLQGNVSANLLNLTSLYNYKGASLSAEASALNAQDARELVILAVAGSYMQVLGTQAEIVAQTDQVRYADASYRQANTQAEAGTKADIDANRRNASNSYRPRD